MEIQLPKFEDVPGFAFYFDEKRNRFRIQFRRRGKRKTITLTTTDPGNAIAQAYDYAKRYNAGRYDPWSRQAKRTDVTVRTAIKEYLDSIKHLRPATIEQRCFVLNAFRDRLPAATSLRRLTLADLRAYYEDGILAAATRRTYYNVLNTWLRWCVKQGLLDASPLADVKRPKVSRGLPAYFTPEQFRILLNHIQTESRRQQTLSGVVADNQLADYADLVVIAVETGLRRGELLHFRWMDVDFRRGVIHVRAYEDKRRRVRFVPKDLDARVVPLSPVARRVLANRNAARTDEDDTRAVFASPKTDKPRNGRSVSKQMRKFIRDAGLPAELHLHSLRHTFASWLASGGCPIVTIQKWMGHASIEQTQVYASLLPSALDWHGSCYHEAAYLPSNGSLGVNLVSNPANNPGN